MSRLLLTFSCLVLLLSTLACQATGPRLMAGDVGLLEVWLQEGRSPGSVEDAREALGPLIGDAAWASQDGERLVARVRTQQPLPLASLFEHPFEARRLQLTARGRLVEESVQLEVSGQRLALAPGLGAREEVERNAWLVMAIEQDEDGLFVERIELRDAPTVSAQDDGEAGQFFLPDERSQ